MIFLNRSLKSLFKNSLNEKKKNKSLNLNVHRLSKKIQLKIYTDAKS